MGQGISVEADPAGLKELLSAGAGTLSHLESPNAVSLNLTSSHHVKAWCFEARGRSVVEAVCQVWPGHCYGVFVWHGRSTEPLFRAEVRCKAWELDSALRKSLPIQREFAESLRPQKR
eukprot:g10688.t1